MKQVGHASSKPLSTENSISVKSVMIGIIQNYLGWQTLGRIKLRNLDAQNKINDNVRAKSLHVPYMMRWDQMSTK